MNPPAKPIEICDDEILDGRMLEVFRSKTEAQRLAIAHDMWSSARQMLLHVLAGENPDWDRKQIEQEAARRLSHGAV